MGIRETLNKQPAIATGATILIILVAFICIIYQLTAGSHQHVKIPTKAYFTTDDGASYFVDDITRVPPYDYSGQMAVKAYVFKCPGKKAFVGYLERYTPEAKKAIDSSHDHPDQDPNIVNDAMQMGVQVKLPLTGDKGWVKTSSADAQKIVNPVCPDGSDTPEMQLP